jgi:hypothetical protein
MPLMTSRTSSTMRLLSCSTLRTQVVMLDSECRRLWSHFSDSWCAPNLYCRGVRLTSPQPVPGEKARLAARSKMFSIGSQIVSESKVNMKASTGEKTPAGRDLLSVLLKANLATNIPETQRLSETEVIARTYLCYFESLVLTASRRDPHIFLRR